MNDKERKREREKRRSLKRSRKEIFLDRNSIRKRDYKRQERKRDRITREHNWKDSYTRIAVDFHPRNKSKSRDVLDPWSVERKRIRSVARE